MFSERVDINQRVFKETKPQLKMLGASAVHFYGNGYYGGGGLSLRVLGT
jgi:hypothetical protein